MTVFSGKTYGNVQKYRTIYDISLTSLISPVLIPKPNWDTSNSNNEIDEH